MVVIPEIKKRTEENEQRSLDHIDKEISLMQEKRDYISALDPRDFERTEPDYAFEKHEGWMNITKKETLNEIDREIANRRNEKGQIMNGRDQRQFNEQHGGANYD